jgi:hypothetical protein
MKLAYFLWLLVVACNGSSSSGLSSGMDSLKKYSCYISGYNGKSLIKGTGFFVRSNDRFFFITSKNLISPYDTSCNLLQIPNYWTIFLPDTGGNVNFTSLKMDLNLKKTQNAITCPFTPDIISIKMNDSIGDRINYIDSRIVPLSMSQTEDSVVVYGYPYFYKGNTRTYLLKPTPYIVGVCQITTDPSNNFNCRFISEKIDMNDSLKGYSGAPVFGKSSDTGKWQFIGCWLTASQHNRSMTLIKPSTIYEKIVEREQ